MLTTEGYRAFENLEIYYLFIGLLAGVVLLFLSYARSQDVIQRKQLKLVLAGIVAGFGPFAFLSLISMVVRVPHQFLEVALIPQILIPISLTYALFKYRLMDVDIIIKRGMIYTLTTLLVFVMYIVLTISWLRFLDSACDRKTHGSGCVHHNIAGGFAIPTFAGSCSLLCRSCLLQR